MKISIYGGEAFPIYGIQSINEYDASKNIEVNIETLKRWKKVFDEFNVVQQEIENTLDSQGHDYWSSHPLFDGFEEGILEDE